MVNMEGISKQNFRIEASIHATMIGSVVIEAGSIEEAR